MEPLSSGLTWRQVQEKFAADPNWDLSLQQRARRAKKPMRHRGEADERKVWRLIVQDRSKSRVRTRLRKNIRTEDANLLSQPVDDRLIAHLNQIIA